MLNLIPAPKKCIEYDGALVTLPFAIITDKEAWNIHVLAFCDSFEKGHGTCLEIGKKGGVELVFDSGIAEDSYRLVTEDTLRIYASASEGVTYGLATALQLCRISNRGILAPKVEIEDSPDKDYRSLMVDIGREWHPFDKLLKYVDLCFFYKVKYLNLHFADNKLYTLPTKAFPKLCVPGKYYKEEEIAFLREYAKARGVVLIPELECPGHAPVLNTYYPEVFMDRREGSADAFYNESGELISDRSLLCAGSERAVEGVKTLIREICDLFPEAPYIHIGGDEANISLWNECSECRRYMEQNGIDDVYGLYSDYVARVTSYVLSLGKTPMVWEGFPRKGSDKIPPETVVFSWENHYQTTHELLEAGFPIVNASWKPLYLVPDLIAASPTFSWNARSIFEWNVYNWQHWWEKSVATLNPINIEPTDQVKGAMLCVWEMTYEQEITVLMAHIAAFAERTWTTERTRTFEEYSTAFKPLYALSARLIQDR